MNKVNLIGNLTKDPELKTTSNGNAVCSFSIAVQRGRTGQNGEKVTDFINCVAWRKNAENMAKYLSKGKKVGVSGSLQSRTYEDKNGKKVFVIEVVCDDYGGVEFLSPKGEPSAAPDNEAAAAAYGAPDEQHGFVEVDDDELPF